LFDGLLEAYIFFSDVVLGAKNIFFLSLGRKVFLSFSSLGAKIFFLS